MNQTCLQILRESLKKITAGASLTSAEMAAVVDELVSADLTDYETGLLASAFICALKTKGETYAEVLGVAQSLRRHQIHLPLQKSNAILLDTCGTGGDGAHLINISTITGLVVAALGVTVAKHGNRSVSSSCGSADLLEEMGYPLHTAQDQLIRGIEETGFGFLFAPNFHPALKNLGNLRRLLGVRTVFNMLGPLVNPAGVTHQLIGVFEQKIVKPVAQAASHLGLKKCVVVHGEGGLDELSPNGVSYVAVTHGDKVEEFEWTPDTFGAKPIDLEFLAGGNARQNALITRALFRGEKPEIASAVAMNGAVCLWLVGLESDLKKAYHRCFSVIQSGKVEVFFERAKASAFSTLVSDSARR